MACCNTKMAAKGHMMKNTHKERMHCYLIVVHILITGLETFSQLVYRNPDGSVKLVQLYGIDTCVNNYLSPRVVCLAPENKGGYCKSQIIMHYVSYSPT